MKNKIIYMVFALLFAFLPMQGTASAQDDAEVKDIINPQTLLQNCDEEIFKRFSLSQDYSEDQGYVNEFPNRLTLHQYYIFTGEGSDMLMTMQPSLEVVNTTNKRLTFDQARNREFHASYSVVRREDIPDGSGGICWIRYSNVVLTGAGKESGVIFYPGDQAYFFSPVDGQMTYHTIGDLSDLNPSETAKFDFIRLEGTTYIYVNGTFRFSYEDGITDTVSFEGGSELYLDGNRVRCAFDDFSMRIK